MEGQDVFGINELENGASYVAVGRGDRFLKVPYGSTNVKVLPKKTKPKLKPLHKPPKPKVPAVVRHSMAVTNVTACGSGEMVVIEMVVIDSVQYLCYCSILSSMQTSQFLVCRRPSF